jgi:hypothetical protein
MVSPEILRHDPPCAVRRQPLIPPSHPSAVSNLHARNVACKRRKACTYGPRASFPAGWMVISRRFVDCLQLGWPNALLSGWLLLLPANDLFYVFSVYSCLFHSVLL